MYQISDEVIKLIEKTRENWRVELTTGGKSVTVVKVQRGNFQGGALSSLLFVIATMSLNTYLGNVQADKNLQNRKKKKNRSPNVHGRHITVFPKWKTIRNLTIDSENIQWRYRNGIIRSGKWHIKKRINLPNQEKIRRLGKKETNKYLGILEADTIEQVEMKEKGN